VLWLVTAAFGTLTVLGGLTSPSLHRLEAVDRRGSAIGVSPPIQLSGSAFATDWMNI
jgi:hypothetical protein